MVRTDGLIKFQVSHQKDSDHLMRLVADMNEEVMLMRLIAPHGLAEIAHACLHACLTNGRARAEELEGKFEYAARKDLAGETVNFEDLDSRALHRRERATEPEVL